MLSQIQSQMTLKWSVVPLSRCISAQHTWLPNSQYWYFKTCVHLVLIVMNLNTLNLRHLPIACNVTCILCHLSETHTANNFLCLIVLSDSACCFCFNIMAATQDAEIEVDWQITPGSLACLSLHERLMTCLRWTWCTYYQMCHCMLSRQWQRDLKMSWTRRTCSCCVWAWHPLSRWKIMP